MDELDIAVVDALRTAPLVSPPPSLFQAVMDQVSVVRYPAPGAREQVPGGAGPLSNASRRSPAARRPSSVPPPSFRVSWLDLALSLFGAGVIGAAWLAWSSVSPQWAAYWRMYALWSVQRAWYTERDVMVWLVFALAALCAGLLAAGLSCARLGICSQRV